MKTVFLKCVAIGLAAALAAACAPADNGGADATAAANGDRQPGIPDGETGGACDGWADIKCINSADYCHHDAGVCRNTADAMGVCKPKPTVCTDDYAPVCGCDDVTYSNACEAHAVGQSVASDGECAAE